MLQFNIFINSVAHILSKLQKKIDFLGFNIDPDGENRIFYKSSYTVRYEV